MAKNFEHNPVRVVAEKGTSCLSRTSSKSTNITVMACVSASGRRMPPMFVVKGKTSRSLYGFNTEAAPPSSTWLYQKNGWMDDQIGESWFREVFLKHCGPSRPQLLILDGHSSHETLAILMCAMEANIQLLSLPPHTTHHLQPLDKAVFGPVNKAYNKACSQFLQENPLHQINKWTFPSLFKAAWDMAVTPTNITSGFLSCGIYPFNAEVIPPVAYGPSEPTDLPSESTSIAATAPTSSSVAMDTDHDPHVSVVATATYSDTSTTVEPDQSGTHPELSNVLDISDPQQLLTLVSGGYLAIDPIQPIFEEVNDVISIDEHVKQVFLPKCLETPVIKQTQNSITRHRLLTSPEIIHEKMQAEAKKREKELKKGLKKVKMQK